MHHSTYWIIQFLTWSTTWYYREFAHFNFVFVISCVFLCTSIACSYIVLLKKTAGWDPSFDSGAEHSVQAASQKNISSISPHPIANAFVIFFTFKIGFPTVPAIVDACGVEQEKHSLKKRSQNATPREQFRDSGNFFPSNYALWLQKLGYLLTIFFLLKMQC